jgi:hypothetical protein
VVGHRRPALVAGSSICSSVAARPMEDYDTEANALVDEVLATTREELLKDG